MSTATEQKLYTYADYKGLPENQRIELIDGQIYDMAPAPSRLHQEIISELITVVNSYIKSNKGQCKVYPAPFDVILTKSKDLENSRNVVQPDISVICDRTKLTDKGCIGSPDLIIEVVSPFNPSTDYVKKLNLYNIHKVREYWIVNPMNKTILVYRLDNNSQYAAPESYTFRDKVKVGIFDNLEIDFSVLEL
ncbi:Uma2 family endonuclease [Clostridium thermarum]|uniref:Uma2 family endonuclease n=1 Tax=Clostridium thermarum TaxID=1716543 RepID=UPI001122DBBE|nr:Uma2 family endonuclease [Clostridium thermarum]